MNSENRCRHDALGDVGFKPNRRGGWWYREPSNRYSIQIIPADNSKWRVGIAQGGGMRWEEGKQYSTPELAALSALNQVCDFKLHNAVLRASMDESNEPTTD